MEIPQRMDGDCRYATGVAGDWNTLLQDKDGVWEHVKETIREQTLQSLYKATLTLLTA